MSSQAVRPLSSVSGPSSSAALYWASNVSHLINWFIVLYCNTGMERTLLNVTVV